MSRSTPISITFLMLVALTGCSRPRNSAGESASNPAASPASANVATETSTSPAPLGTKVSSEMVVKAAAEPFEIPAGGSGQASVRVTVQKGYHINSNPPSYPYLKATELDVADTGDISVDYIYYPNPLVKKFPFAEKPLKVYEGETPLTIAFNATQSAKKGARSLSGILRIQACDDQVCYPPGSIGVVIPVTVK